MWVGGRVGARTCFAVLCRVVLLPTRQLAGGEDVCGGRARVRGLLIGPRARGVSTRQRDRHCDSDPFHGVGYRWSIGLGRSLVIIQRVRRPLFIGRNCDRFRRTCRAETNQEISDRPSPARAEIADAHENTARGQLRGQIKMVGILPEVLTSYHQIN